MEAQEPHEPQGGFSQQPSNIPSDNSAHHVKQNISADKNHTLSGVKTLHDPTVKREHEQQDEEEEAQQHHDRIRCICGIPVDDGFTIQCDSCYDWQHVVCWELDPNDLPESFLCQQCAPRRGGINIGRARAIQLDRLARERRAPTPSSDHHHQNVSNSFTYNHNRHEILIKENDHSSPHYGHLHEEEMEMHGCHQNERDPHQFAIDHLGYGYGDTIHYHSESPLINQTSFYQSHLHRSFPQLPAALQEYVSYGQDGLSSCSNVNVYSSKSCASLIGDILTRFGAPDNITSTIIDDQSSKVPKLSNNSQVINMSQVDLRNHSDLCICEPSFMMVNNSSSIFLWTLKAYTSIAQGSLISVVYGEVKTSEELCSSETFWPPLLKPVIKDDASVGEASADEASSILPPYVFAHPWSKICGSVFVDSRRHGCSSGKYVHVSCKDKEAIQPNAALKTIVIRDSEKKPIDLLLGIIASKSIPIGQEIVLDGAVQLKQGVAHHSICSCTRCHTRLFDKVADSDKESIVESTVNPLIKNLHLLKSELSQDSESVAIKTEAPIDAQPVLVEKKFEKPLSEQYLESSPVTVHSEKFMPKTLDSSDMNALEYGQKSPEPEINMQSSPKLAQELLNATPEPEDKKPPKVEPKTQDSFLQPSTGNESSKAEVKKLSLKDFMVKRKSLTNLEDALTTPSSVLPSVSERSSSTNPPLLLQSSDSIYHRASRDMSFTAEGPVPIVMSDDTPRQFRSGYVDRRSQSPSFRHDRGYRPYQDNRHLNNPQLSNVKDRPSNPYSYSSRSFVERDAKEGDLLSHPGSVVKSEMNPSTYGIMSKYAHPEEVNTRTTWNGDQGRLRRDYPPPRRGGRGGYSHSTSAYQQSSYNRQPYHSETGSSLISSELSEMAGKMSDFNNRYTDGRAFPLSSNRGQHQGQSNQVSPAFSSKNLPLYDQTMNAPTSEHVYANTFRAQGYPQGKVHYLDKKKYDGGLGLSETLPYSRSSGNINSYRAATSTSTLWRKGEEGGGYNDKRGYRGDSYSMARSGEGGGGEAMSMDPSTEYFRQQHEVIMDSNSARQDGEPHSNEKHGGEYHSRKGW